MGEPIRDPDYLSRMDYYGLIREQLDNENDLLNQRVLWHVVAQSFFFSAFAALVNAPKDPRSPAFAHMAELLFWLIPAAALAAALLSYPAILVSIRSMTHLRRTYETYDVEGQASTRFPPIQGDPVLRKVGYVTPVGLPILFIGTWVAVLVRLAIVAAGS